VREWLKAEAVEEAERGSHEAAHGHDHGDGGHHGHHRHDVNRHDAHIRAFALSSDQPVSRGAFDMFLDLLRSAHGPKLLRVKGLVALADDPERPVVIHGVQHVFHPPATLDAWPEGDDRKSRVVFITRDIAESTIRKVFASFFDAEKKGWGQEQQQQQ
jgi:G3E family GTPase